MEYAYPRFSEILWKHYGSLGSPGNHFSKTWRSLPPSCFLLKQPNFQNVRLDLNFYLHPYLDKFTPLLCWFFFRNVMEPYGLRNDTCFLSVMSWNFSDYATTPSSASGMLRNFMDCAIIFPFDSRHVTKLHGLLNDGCQVPRSGQAKVASHQTMVPGRN